MHIYSSYTSRGSRKDSPVPGEGLHGGQPTVTLHETHLILQKDDYIKFGRKLKHVNRVVYTILWYEAHLV